jgi:hypothetical protein
MSKQLLLPNKFKAPGWFLLAIAIIGWTVAKFGNQELSWLDSKVFAIYHSEIINDPRTSFTVISNNITDELIGVLFIIGAFFVGFSREKKEDEFIANLRLSSLLWSVYVSYSLLLLAMIFVYGTAFFTVMVYNMFTVLIIFIIRFNYILYKNSKPSRYEK